MKAVMVSIQPKWCELIANGKKTIEVRKTRPKMSTPFKCYIYCTKAKEVVDIGKTFSWGKEVIGEFVCDRIEEYTFFSNLAKFSNTGLPYGTFSSYLIFEDDYKKMCLYYDEVKKYGNGKTLYGWHISDLVIYDKPKSLEMFPIGKIARDCGCGGYMIYDKILTKPPQSWCYVEEKESK